MTDDPVPLCVDCRHYRAMPSPPLSGYPTTRISHQCLRRRSPVTGEIVALCAEQERSSALCGPLGFEWEPKA
jgi:hypothetical protein